MNFAEVLDRAWKITWKHKVLWIFGILAGCARGRAGGGFGGGSGWRQGQPFSPNTTLGVQQFFAGIVQWIGGHLWVVALFVLLAVVLVLLAMFLGTIGRIALIRGTFEADGGAEKLAFGALFRGSLPFFWRVFGLTFLIGLAFFIVLMPLIVFGVVTAGIGFLCILPLLCVLAVLAWVVGIVVHQVNAAMVIENLGLADGVRRGWDVVKRNVGSVLVIWLITGVIGLVVGFVIVLPVLLIVIPAAIGFAAAGRQLSSTFLVAGAACLTIYLPVLLVAGGILTTYTESLWTLTFLRLRRPRENTGTLASPQTNA
jgi:hypothetical protein